MAGADVTGPAEQISHRADSGLVGGVAFRVMRATIFRDVHDLPAVRRQPVKAAEHFPNGEAELRSRQSHIQRQVLISLEEPPDPGLYLRDLDDVPPVRELSGHGRRRIPGAKFFRNEIFRRLGRRQALGAVGESYPGYVYPRSPFVEALLAEFNVRVRIPVRELPLPRGVVLPEYLGRYDLLVLMPPLTRRLVARPLGDQQGLLARDLTMS